MNSNSNYVTHFTFNLSSQHLPQPSHRRASKRYSAADQDLTLQQSMSSPSEAGNQHADYPPVPPQAYGGPVTTTTGVAGVS